MRVAVTGEVLVRWGVLLILIICMLLIIKASTGEEKRVQLVRENSQDAEQETPVLRPLPPVRFLGEKERFRIKEDGVDDIQ